MTTLDVLELVGISVYFATHMSRSVSNLFWTFVISSTLWPTSDSWSRSISVMSIVATIGTRAALQSTVLCSDGNNPCRKLLIDDPPSNTGTVKLLITPKIPGHENLIFQCRVA